jgi:ubiquitin-activating enzyme E1
MPSRIAPSRCAAKNVILAGVRSVTIHDKKATELRDLSAQFYLTMEDIGKNRAEACKDKLQELNTSVAVKASSEDLTEAFLKGFQVRAWVHAWRGCPPMHGWEVVRSSRQHDATVAPCIFLAYLCTHYRLTGHAAAAMQVVVLTGASLAESKKIDEICRAQTPPIAFIRAETRGVFASVFTDFGPEFTVFDQNGAPPPPPPPCKRMHACMHRRRRRLG